VPPSDFVTTSVAARAIGVAPRTLAKWVQDGLVTPALITAGGHYRWQVDELREQLRAMRRERDE
jgi:DNA-binding transcriptional MerR regulator